MPDKQKNTKLFLLLLVPIITLLAGCEFKDIDKNVFVSIIGIDKSDDEDKPYKITLKLYVPTSSFKQSPEPEYAYLSQNGETLSEAIRMLESYSDKELEFGHSKLIVIGEELLKEQKVSEILDFLLRRPDIQMISWIAVGRPSAEEIVKMVSQGENAAYPALFNYFEDIGTESQYIVTTFLFDFRRRLTEDGIDPVLPIIEGKKKKKHFEINKAYVLVNKKEPYELSSLYTQTFNILSMNASVADLSTKREGQQFVARIDSINSKFKVIVKKNNKIELDMDTSLVGYISESKNQLKTEDLSYYSRLFEAEGEKFFTDFLTEMMNIGADPLGFGVDYNSRILHNKRMSAEEWNEAYKNAEIKLKVHADLKSTGIIQ
ncbi:Ger(x)C family spore germination protein [Ureibacillus sinduriensis]|uniref:Spore gernimation protein n=1 Tax=Ureibacillus sinduriensis BLB-1 = JCM 15800 TaxID=1384057 RepID=A0A0A3I5M3_9BACL|nr:Ger(x)C family spore germination protein [Ureibacillus sinduriensis]KGR78775.1 spore gernimation protein [Ureibacillus sinduriensis BLB-1 = JCM 15800]